MSGMRRDIMAEIPRGSARAVFYEDHEAVEEALDIAREGEIRLIIKQSESIPQLNRLLRELLQKLADIAGLYWPDWYAKHPASEIDPNISVEILFTEIVTRNPPAASSWPVLKSWFKAAAKLCQASKPPLPKGFGQEVQFNQLALAIDPMRLAIAFLVDNKKATQERIEGLAKASAWVAGYTNARVAVFVPLAWEAFAGLDAIRFGALSLTSHKPRVILELSQKSEGEELIPPLDGEPHPASLGEQLLAKHLESDGELDGLFVFNMPVETICGSRPRVDLLWREGRLVVEVDGYQYHSDRWRFSADRNRDYELVISGYLVLRLPHDEVVADPELNLEKIRDVVRFRRGQLGG